MKASLSHFNSFRRLSPREQRVVSGGAAICATVLIVTFVVVPLANRWMAREASYAVAADQWQHDQALLAHQGDLRRALDAHRQAQQALSTLLLTGATPALAASDLQILLQRYAQESMAQLDRVDVTGEPKPDQSGLLAIPVLVQGQGDIYGLVDFLSRIEGGTRLLVIDEMTLSAAIDGAGNPNVIAWSVQAHGLYAELAQLR